MFLGVARSLETVIQVLRSLTRVTKSQAGTMRSQMVAGRNKTDVATSQAGAKARSEDGCNKVYSGNGTGNGIRTDRPNEIGRGR